MEPAFELHHATDIPREGDGPSEEELAMLLDGSASSWLRAQLVGAIADSPDLASLMQDLLDPAHREAVGIAGDQLDADPSAGIVLVKGVSLPAPLPVEVPSGREVPLRLRADNTPLLLAMSALVAGFLWDHAKLAFNIAGVMAFLIFLMDFYATRPFTHYQRAVAAGDNELAQAILERFLKVSAG
ncbi:MAG: hypothetical protein ABI743_01085 [bacterium]